MDRPLIAVLVTLMIIINSVSGYENPKSESNEGWSDWSSWSLCSSSCSNGLVFRTRTCLHKPRPHIISKDLCIGKRLEHRVCNLKPCPNNSPDLWSIRCGQYNGRFVNGFHVSDWIPNRNVSNPCELSCKTQVKTSKPLIYSFGKLDDGTSCSTNDNSVCLNGRCMPVGCDSIVGSKKTEDKCGICGGKRETCHKVKHMVTSSMNWSADETSRIIYTIPMGSRHIIIKEGTQNYIGITSANRHPVINGPQRLDSPGPYKAAGATFHYSRDSNGGHEVIRTNGPINETIHIMVINRKDVSKIYYEYWAPNESQGKPNRSLDKVLKDLTTFTIRDTNKSELRGKLNEEKNVLVKSVKNPKKEKLPGKCPPCEQSKNLKKHFCRNEFALRVVVIGSSVIKSHTRYELEVIQSYKNSVHLQSREFLWIPLICKCPKIVLHREYVIMGVTDKNLVKRELRLAIDGNSYIRRFSHRRSRQLYRLKKDRVKICGDEKSKNKTR